jgi:hypothetical protein
MAGIPNGIVWYPRSELIERKDLLHLNQVLTATEGGSVSRAEAPASAFADATSKPADGWLRALAARLPGCGETPLVLCLGLEPTMPLFRDLKS